MRTGRASRGACRSRVGGFVLVVLCVGAFTECRAKTWTGGSGNWNAGGNWDPVGIPGAGDDIVISQAGANVMLDSATTVQSLIVGSTAVLTFTNWTTKLTVSGDVTVQSGGTITLPPAFQATAMSNRVWIACDNLTVDANGKIDVAGRGYTRPPVSGATQWGWGPGASFRWGSAGHGGVGGSVVQPWGVAGKVYGSAANPELPGSSSGEQYGNYGGAGGGVIRIEAGGDVTVNGLLTANGQDITSGSGGSGGSVYIACSTIRSAGGGVISAAGGAATVATYCSGGGGRIAVIYDTGAQAAVSPVPAIRFDAGTRGNPQPGGFGDLGTLYFPDNYFLSTTITSLSGQWMAPSFTGWSVGSLLISNAWIRFPASNFKLTVTNNLTIIGTGKVPSAGLGLGGDRFYSTMLIPYSGGPGPELNVGGHLTLTKGALLTVYAGVTNSSTALPGALVRVRGELGVASNCWIYPYSQITNGGCVQFSVGSLRLDNGGGIDAAGKGYAGGTATRGHGPGAGNSYAGGSYGGTGGYHTGSWPFTSTWPPYGDANAPNQCGSSGGNGGSGPGMNGGGLVRILADGAITLNGTITANGHHGGYYQSAGSGGGIYLSGRVLQGSSTGRLLANGGNEQQNGNAAGSGGGGRIAVWRGRDAPVGLPALIAPSANAGTQGALMSGGTAGTIVWDFLPPSGTVVSIR